MKLLDLFIRIVMKDETSKPLKDVEQNTNKVENKMKKLGGTVDKWVTRGMGIIGGGALLEMGKKAVMLASDINECDNVIDTTFGQGNKTIETFTSSCGKNFGMSTLDAKKFTGSLGAMLKSSGVTGKGLEDMTTSLVGLSGDFASFYNLGHEEAFEKIRSGISGETEPLKSLGINMSVANLQAYALSQGITKKFNAMSQGEQIQLRYNYLLSVSKDASGDFVRTQDQFANQLRICQLGIQENARALGEKLLPYVTACITWINKNSETIKTWTKVLATALGIIVMYKVINSIVGFISAWRKVTQAMTISQMALNAVMMLNPVTLIVMAIIGLIGALVLAYNKCEWFRNMVNSAWEGIKQATIYCWGAIVNFFTVIIPNAIEYLKQKFAPLINFIGAIFTGIKDIAVTVFTGLINFFTQTIPNFVSNFVAWFQDLPNKMSQLWQNIKNFFINGWNSIVNFFTVSIPQFISNFITFLGQLPYKIGFVLGFVIGKFIKLGIDLFNWVVTTVPKIINSIITFFRELPNKVWTWLVNTYNKVTTWGVNMFNKAKEVGSKFINNVINFIKNLPSKVYNFIMNTYNKVVSWGSKMIAKAKEVGVNFVNGAINFIQQLPSKIWNFLSQTFNKVVTWGSNMVSKGVEAMGRFKDAVINAVVNLPSKFMEIGQNIVRGVWNGITGMASWIGEKVSSFFSGIVDGAKSALGIHSPSRVFRDQVGKFMAEGVGVGFENEMEKTKRSIQDNLNDTVKAPILPRVKIALDKVVNLANSDNTLKVKSIALEELNSNLQASIKPLNMDKIEFEKEQNTNLMRQMCDLMETLVNKDVIIKTEQGREFARLVAPYQREFKKYNNRNLAFE